MITIIDYNAGNIRSVQRACSEVGVASSVSSVPGDIEKAEKIIFPGVGAAPSAMSFLAQTGLDKALKNAFMAGKPILGICLGTQIVLESSEEGGQECLGLVPGKTVRLNVTDRMHKIPHMGWNEVKVVQLHPLLEGIKAGDEFYFVHSFYPRPAREEYVYGVTCYESDFCSALGYKNLFATQFHPEKSGRLGLEMLGRFARWDGRLRDEKPC